MSGSILNFSQDITNAEPPPPLPVGSYPAEIIGAQKRTSAASSKEYAQIMFRINAEAYPADYTEGDPDGTTLMYNRLQTADTPNNRHRWKQFLRHVGASTGHSVDLNALIGLTCMVEITHQEFEGEQRAQIARILPP